ncbi:MAG: hypothetical protein RL767_1143, partial [Bacteroidota bacterium]
MEANQSSSPRQAARRPAGTLSLPLAGGKLPPQATELEEAVLGSLMIDRNALSKVIDILTPETFYLESHQLIFSAVKDLFGASEAVDILTVAQLLRKGGNLDRVGGESK